MNCRTYLRFVTLLRFLHLTSLGQRNNNEKRQTRGLNKLPHAVIRLSLSINYCPWIRVAFAISLNHHLRASCQLMRRLQVREQH